ncbi:MAG: class B sortase [Clostridia bacterium]|nr:class B sortase [Clostridia bacterium]
MAKKRRNANADEVIAENIPAEEQPEETAPADEITSDETAADEITADETSPESDASATDGIAPEEVTDADLYADEPDADEFVTAPLEELPGAGFEETVEDADVTKIKSTYKGKKTRVLNASFFMRFLLLALCGALFMYSAVSIANRFADDMKSEQFIDDLRSNSAERSAVARQLKSKACVSPLCLFDALGVDEYTPEFNEPEVSDRYDSVLNTISQLKAINPEIYGWIRCTGGMLSIDYPVIKAKDNEKYLRRNIYGEYSVGGTIFVDYRDSDRHGESYNTIFYGHNMTNGTMFRAIKDWFESTDREATAPLINVEIITPQATYVYEIFSAYRSDGSDFITVSFRDNETYTKFLKTILSRSVLKRRTAYDENTRIITLSTCTNSGRNEDERYVVHCKLIKIIKYS